MNGWLSVTPDYPEFAFFFTAAFAVGALLLVHRAAREKWQLVPWLTIILWGATFGLIGSKLILIPAGGWLEGFAHHYLPPTDQKTLLGGLLGGIAGIWLSRRWLGFPRPVADAYALVLPLATAIGRIGCLVGGCCFGTRSSLPWSITYGPGSDALAAHRAQGLLPPGAACSLPVHPLQLYDILLMLGLALLLWRARRYLRRNGSLFLLYLAAYGTIRFGEEFIREGGASAAGLKYVQWGLVAGVALALAILIARERRSVRGPETAPAPVGKIRISLALLAVLAVIVAGFGWFTPLERTIVILHVALLGAVIVRALVPEGRRGLLRRGAVTLAAGAALAVQSDSARVSYTSFHLAGSFGGYNEICGGYHRFGVGTAGLSRTIVYDRYSSTAYGLRGYVGADEAGENGYYYGSHLIAGVNPYVSFESRWAGGGLGLHAGNLVVGWSSGEVGLFPSAHLRLGPRKIAYLEGSFADHALGGMPQPVIQLGLGHEFDNGNSVLIGAAYTGVFVESRIRAGSRLDLTPYVSFYPAESRTRSYQLGMALRWRLGP